MRQRSLAVATSWRQVPIAEPVLHYLAYCDELDVWGQYFLAKRSVGETDRALWVFYELAYGPHADPKSRNEYQKAFRDDPWVQKRHADNLLGPFFRQYTPLKQAGFLLGVCREYVSTSLALRLEIH